MHGGAPVAVVDQGVPIYELGVAEVLRRAGLDVSQSDEPLAWVSEPGNRALVLVVRSETDWLLLEGLAQVIGSRLVAVLEKPNSEMYRKALDQVGALAAIGWNAEPDDLVKTVIAAVAGDRLLPQSIATIMHRPGPEPVPDWYGFEDEELYLLQGLRVGETQVSMAHHLGRSDRRIRAKLAALYRTLGVRNGPGAIAKTANWDLGRR